MAFKKSIMKNRLNVQTRRRKRNYRDTAGTGKQNNNRFIMSNVIKRMPSSFQVPPELSKT